MDFYDELAGDYDAITGSAGRAERAQEFLKALAARFPIKSALDAACGTGLYAIQLAGMGVRSVGADISPGMLEQARRLAQQAKLNVEWVCAPMQELAAKLPERFDAVLCMGNSIPHLLSDADLDATLAAFLQLLNPGGIVVLQLLNYARRLGRQERIVGINRRGQREFVRFYDFQGDQAQFNILEIDWSTGQPQHRLHTTTLRLYTAEALRQALNQHGSERVELFSGLDFAPFDNQRDETVMLIAHKR
jgi:SAM-dependent methyltransferase